MADFHLRIYTPEKLVYQGEVTAVTAPAEDGYVGVLAHHAPLVSVLGHGTLVVRKGTQIEEFTLDGGFLEVHNNQATILADRLSAA